MVQAAREDPHHDEGRSILVEGFSFLECPRWHEGLLWVSEMHSDRVLAISESGAVERVIAVPGRPGGLGWLPDGDMVVVSTRERQILRVTPGGLRVHADLGNMGCFAHELNDMAVSKDGRCYVGEFGVDVHAWLRENRQRIDTEGTGALRNIDFPRGSVFVVEKDGGVSQTVPGFIFPNGSSVSGDCMTFLVAETFGCRLSSFELTDGQLGKGTSWDLGFAPDGLSEPDAEGCIWVADPIGCAVHRVAPGGRSVETIRSERRVYACALGGIDGKSLFLCTSSTADPRQTVVRRDARVEKAIVQVGLRNWRER